MIVIRWERAVATRLAGALHLGQTFTILQSSPNISVMMQLLQSEMHLICTLSEFYTSNRCSLFEVSAKIKECI